MGTLGERLRQRRQELGLTLDEISQKTKIRLPILQALEADEPGPVPAVYMRQFARRYGEFLGIPAEELRQLLEQRFGREPVIQRAAPVGVRQAAEELQARRLQVAQALIYGGLVGAVVAVLYYFFLRPQPQGYSPPQVPAVVVGSEQRSEEPTVQRQSQDTLWRLRARARDTVWLSIIVDGRQSQQLLLHPGQEREWFVRKAVTLSVGNAGGLELWRDGEALPSLGPPGSVVRSVRITADTLQGFSAELQRPRERGKESRHVPPGEKVPAETLPRIAPAPLKPVQPQPEPQRTIPLPQ